MCTTQAFTSLSAVQIYDFHIFFTVYSSLHGFIQNHHHAPSWLVSSVGRALPCLLIQCTVISVFGGVPSSTIFPQQSLPFSQRRSSLGRYYCQFSLLGSVNIYMGYFLWNLKPQGLKSGMKFSFMNRGPNLIYYLGEEGRGVRRFWLLLL